MNRRDFLRILGLAGGTAALACQGKPPEKLIPALVPPEDGVLPGEAKWVPTICTECPAGCGLLARVREGWPVKLEGNPEHPVNRGALCIRGQASLSRLYNPERIKEPLLQQRDGVFQPVSWENALETVGNALKDKGPHLLVTGTVTGTLEILIDEFSKHFAAEHIVFDPLYPSAIAKANGALFGRPVVPSYAIEQADLLVTLGADLLETFVSPVEYTRKIAENRARGGFEWLHLEPHFSLTGSNADRRIGLRPGSEAFLLAYLLRAVPARVPLPAAVLGAAPVISHEQALFETGMDAASLDHLVKALASSRTPLLIAGGVATAGPGGEAAAMMAALIQYALGMIESTVDFRHYLGSGGGGGNAELLAWAEARKAERGGVFIAAGADPLPHMPELREATGRASFRVGIGDTLTPTMRACTIVLPLSLPLETWGDPEYACASMSGQNVFAPAIAPLHSTRSLGDILQNLMGNGVTWEGRIHARFSLDSPLYESGFTQAILKSDPGVKLLADAKAEGLFRLLPVPKAPVAVVVPSVRTGDGRSAALPLLHEIPDPLSTVTYGRWLSVSTEDATRLGVQDRDVVTADLDGAALDLPVKVQTGLSAGVFMIQRPFLAGEKLSPARFAAAEPDALLPLKSIRAKGERVRLPILSGGMTATGRGLLPEPHGAHTHNNHQATLYPEHEHQDYRWGMAIDLDKCTGCSSCVAACYLENNIRLTGLDEHAKGREMAWIRLEPYFGADGALEFLPMLCQHCDHAPCEAVCPVLATYHNPEGLNAQVYNRCVGTRYCANNCPYKVRRFNWIDHPLEEPLPKMTNPDLSRRPKGVMEKCSFCIQRIVAAKDKAKDEGRKVRDGDFTTACAQTCPASAIIFGNLMDPASAVSRMAASPRAYRVLEPLGTRPAVYYLKSVADGLQPAAGEKQEDGHE
jgi:molybdopterin-containing oxidoreductase family iron-sulfur binding subunit